VRHGCANDLLIAALTVSRIFLLHLPPRPDTTPGLSPEETHMSLREQFTDRLKISMKAGDSATTMTLRSITAKVKDIDIAARPKGIDKVSDDEILSALRSMVKTRRESIVMYQQGNRPELAAKEEAEIAVIEQFLPAALDESALKQAVADAVAETGATSQKEMGKVMAALKAKFGAGIDMSVIGPLVKAALN
jgi:uncharacterized protein YqeY